MQKKMMKSIAVFAAALMMVCFLPSAFASQDSAQKHNMDGMMHGNVGGSAKFSLDNATFEIQQERMLEQINDTISMIGSGEIDDENITAEMLDNATTQLEQAKTIVENAEDVADLKEAGELIHSAMETLGLGPVMMGRPEALPEEDSFEIMQERMLEQINDTISKIDSGEIDDENITAEMLDNATTQLEQAKTIVENAEDVADLKEAGELIHSAMETLGLGPVMMGRPEALPEEDSFEIMQERMLEQINDTISKIDSGEIDDENITAEMLDNATTQLEQAKTIVENAEDVADLKEARELIHSAIETLGMEPENRHGMEPGSMDDKGMFQGNESLETQQEKMLEQINDTISKIDSGEIDDENITAEMLDNATTQLEQAKTIVENAEDVDDLKEAGELIHSAMETLGMEPENRHGMEPGPMDDKGMPRDMSNPGMKSINQSSES